MVLISLIPFIFAIIVVLLLVTRRNIATDPFATIELPGKLLLIIGIITLIINIFIYKGAWGLGAGLVLTGLVGVTGFIVGVKHKQTQWLVVLGFIFALLISGRANGFVQVVDFIFVLGVIGLLLITRFKEIEFEKGGLIGRTFYYGLTAFQNIFSLPAYLLKRKDGQVSFISIIKICGFTFVLLVLFAAILSTADPVFAKLIENFMSEFVGRTIVTVFFVSVFIVIVSVKQTNSDTNSGIFNFVSTIEILIPVIAVVGLLLVFIGVQVTYLFGSHSDLARFGFTYSEYVRRGFIELLIATAVGGVLAYVLFLKKSTQGWLSKLVTIANVVLIIELGILLVSALKRDLLYIDMFGFTRTRLIGGFVLIWLAGLLLLLLGLNLIKKLNEKYFWKWLGLLTLILIVSINIFNVDEFIATQNPPSVTNKQPEYYYLASLSEDAINGWINIIPKIESDVNLLLTKNYLSDEETELLANSKLALVQLREKRIRLEKKFADYNLARNLLEIQTQYYLSELDNLRSWKAFNLSEWNAYQIISDNPKFKQIDCLLEKIIIYQKEKQIETYSAEYKVMQINRPFLNYQMQYYPMSVINPDYINPQFVPVLNCNN